MNDLQATVLVPTFDHGPMLRYSVGSALTQTVEQLEVLIVGDGVPPVTQEVVAELSRDPRVRFFDHPKGARHGEAYRHSALLEARGRIVCYLSDDDLWTTDHVAAMLDLLADADFAHALPVRVEPDGGIGGWATDLSLRRARDLHLSGANSIPFSCGAHTITMYRRLPHGWRTTPAGTPTDLYMWQQFLAQPACRAVSGTRPTVVHFASPDRRGWTAEQRLDELHRWSRKLSTQVGRRDFERSVFDWVVRDCAALAAEMPPAWVRTLYQRLKPLGWPRRLFGQDAAAGPVRPEGPPSSEGRNREG